MKNNLTYKGIIKGFYMPILPENIYKLYYNIFIIIIRLIVGFSFFLVLNFKQLKIIYVKIIIIYYFITFNIKFFFINSYLINKFYLILFYFFNNI